MNDGGINAVSEAIGQLRAQMGQLTDAVRGYRADLNGKLDKFDQRIQSLEDDRTRRKGAIWVVRGFWTIAGGLGLALVWFRDHIGITFKAMALAIVILPALAAPPSGADPDSPIARWLHKYPGCCGEADCRPANVRGNEITGYEVRHTEGAMPWVRADASVIKPDSDNPTGQTWACINYAVD